MPEINGHPLSHFYDNDGEWSLEGPEKGRWQIGVYKRVFSFKNTADAPDADELLLTLFQHFIDIAQQDGNAKKYCCFIRSPQLHKPIWIPYRRFDQNTAHAILVEFKKRQASGDKLDLLDGPLTMEIITGPLDNIPSSSFAGSGRPAKRFHFNINRSNLIEVDNSHDNYCLFYALELSRRFRLAKNATEKQAINRLISGRTVECERYRRLLIDELFAEIRRSGDTIPPNLASYSIEEHLPIVERYYNHKWPGQFRISVFDQHCNPVPLYKGKAKGQHEITLLHEIDSETQEGHFHGIRTVTSFLGVRNYCFACESSYNSAKDHKVKCKDKCMNCCQMGQGPCPKQENFSITCEHCNKWFSSYSCYCRHLDDSICNLYKRCTQCGLVYTTAGGSQHKCYHKQCRKCKGYHKVTGMCYVQKPYEREEEDYRVLSFDFECTMNHSPKEGGLLHLPNCVGVHINCTKCEREGKGEDERTGDCEICGPDRDRMTHWTSARWKDPLGKFVDWLLHSFDDEFLTLAISHNGGRYDMHFILGELYKQGGICPEMIKSGEKLYQFTVKRKKGLMAKTIFRDSINWMPLRLGQIPSALGLRDMDGVRLEDKGWFPYSYNKNENLHVRLDNLPPMKYYQPECMSEEKAIDFYHYYYVNAVLKKSPFCLSEALVEYCMNDVKILARGLMTFRKLWMGITGDDVIRNTMTTPSACQRHFIKAYMNNEEIAIIPERGYRKMDRQSAKALKFLKWLAFDRSIKIQHRDTVAGEYRLGPYKLDGFVEREGERNLCIEFNGCAWHGCPCIYDTKDMCPNGRTAETNRLEDKKRKEFIERSMEVEIHRECDVDWMLEHNAEMRRFFENCPDTGPIDPRDAFFGGRTGPLALKCDLENDEKLNTTDYQISNLDIISLYPEQNFRTEYPIGHGVEEERNADVHWTDPSQNPYKGLVKCFIVPPRELLVPVVPRRHNGKLMFPLCDACARDSERRSIPLKKPLEETASPILCPHSDERRGFVTTLTHLELNHALLRGYIVTHVYTALVWEEWSDNLFRPYIQDFMRIKVEASGWPDECKSDEEKMAYIAKYKEVFGITIDPEKVEKNAGLRYIAKICLNSMWGKWGMRNNLSSNLVTNRPQELWKVLNDKKLDVGVIRRLAPDLYMLNYKKKGDFVVSHDKFNIVLALFTTSAARLRLLGYMEQVAQTPGCRLLYTDTDSIFVLHPRGKCPIECGDFLGDMSDQYPSHDILSYYSTGCKAYALKMKNKETRRIDFVVKVKGLSLNREASERVHFNTFKETVSKFGEKLQPIKVPMDIFRPNAAEGKVVTHRTQKIFRGVFDKAMVDSHLICYPFGYIGPPAHW